METRGAAVKRLWALCISLTVLMLMSGCAAEPHHAIPDPGSTAMADKSLDSAGDAYLDEDERSDSERAAEIMDRLLYEQIEPKYRSAGLTLSFSDWKSLGDTICIDVRSGGDGFYTVGDVQNVPESTQADLAETAYILLALACDPSIDEGYFESMSEVHVRIAPEYSRRLAAAGIHMPAATEDQDSMREPRNEAPYSHPQDYDYQPPSRSGGGYRVTCRDGSFSNAGGRQGACSSHGGVSK